MSRAPARATATPAPSFAGTSTPDPWRTVPSTPRVGSLSANSDPSRVFKNKHMAGQWGNERVTVQNLEVVRVDGERNLLFVKGALPGPNGGLLLIRDSVKA